MKSFVKIRFGNTKNCSRENYNDPSEKLSGLSETELDKPEDTVLWSLTH